LTTKRVQTITSCVDFYPADLDFKFVVLIQHLWTSPYLPNKVNSTASIFVFLSGETEEQWYDHSVQGHQANLNWSSAWHIKWADPELLFSKAWHQSFEALHV